MKKWALMLSIIIIMHVIGKAQDINIQDIKKVAYNFITANTSDKEYSENELELMGFSKNDTLLVYIVHNNSNFIILSNDLRTEPILAYSFENTFNGANYPPQLLDLIENYKRKILDLKRGNVKSDRSYENEWNKYISGEFSNVKASVSPLIKVNWDQGAGWNRFCPEDEDGPGGRMYVGCVAVAMAQAMSVYEYPNEGDFNNIENTTYEWDLMQINSPDDYNSLLLYHCAVSVNMQFGPDGSGAFTSDVPNAMKKYFDYSTDMNYVGSTGDEQWIEKLKNELDNGRPVIYSGNDGSGTGHAFNIDGYDNSGFFHVNWGWSSSYNGNYNLEALTPGTYDFSYNNSAVFKIAPMDHSPYNIELSKYNLLEKLPVDAVASVIIVDDPDEDDVHTYTIEGTNSIFEEGYCPFYIDGDSLKISEIIEFDQYEKVYIKITAVDLQGNEFAKDFEIHVLKENYAPTDISVSNVSIDDTLSIGSFIGKFNTIDLDEVDTFTYVFEINENSNLSKDNDKFNISNDSLFTNYNFSDYQDNECSIYIKSSDWKGESVTKEFVLTINKTTGSSSFLRFEEKVKLYPNPTSNYINVSVQQEEIELIKIYDIVGNIQNIIEVKSDHVIIDFSDYKSGVYIVSIELDNGQKNTYKILKRD